MRLLFSLIVLGGLIFVQACSPSQNIEESAYVTELDTIEVEPEPEIPIYQASRAKINDLLHTKLEVSFSWDSSYLYGNAWLDLSPHFYDVDSLVLDAKGHRIEEVAMLDELGKSTTLAYEYDTMQLKIDLGRTYTRKDTYKIYIKYTAMPDAFEAGGSAAIRSEKGLYFINPKGEDPDKPKQIWTQGETESSSRWFPTIDAPNQKTTQEIYITVDSVYETLSNGKLLFQTENGDGTRTDYWKQDLPHSPYLFMMAIGDFAIVEDQWRDIPVNYYVEHEYEEFAKDIYPNTPEMIEFFSTKLGYPYPWDKFHQVVVRDYVSGAMENTGAVIYGDFVQGDDRFLIDNSGEDIVAHELFHHWFGDLVTTESWANLPLNESFATYGEYLWNEYKYGKDEADYKLNNDLRAYLNEARIKQEKLIRYDYENEMEMFDTHSYQKGGRVLHMLRREVGDEAFFKSLEVYLNENEFQAAEIDHLRLAFEKVSGRDLHWFFDQWFLSAGHPELKVAHEYVDSSKTLTLHITQEQEGDDIPNAYTLPMDVEIVNADGELITKSITIRKRSESFNFPMNEQPLLVNIDADKSLLGTIDQDFNKSESAILYRKGGNFMDRYLGIDGLKLAKDSSSLAVIEDALNDPHWRIRQQAVGRIKYLAREKPERTMEKLLDMARNDSISKVRAEALLSLSEQFANKTTAETYQAGLNDPSYLVVGSALEALAKVDPIVALEEAEKLENSDNSSVIFTVAKLYSEDGDPKYNSFFVNQLNELSGFSKYPMIISYQEYLAKQKGEVLMTGIDELAEISKSEKSWFMRMAGVNGLIQIKKDHEALIQELEKKISASNDPAATVELKKQEASLMEINSKLNTVLEEIAEVETNSRVKRRIEQELN
jgi:aminopeptidase N